MTLFTWLVRRAPTSAEIRAEIWNLGVRHQGQPLQGARQELARRGLSPAREALLKACIRSMRSAGPPASAATVTEAAW